MYNNKFSLVVLLLLLTTVSQINTAFANEIVTSVPFTLNISSKDKITAKYSIIPNKTVVKCEVDGDLLASIEYRYKGHNYNAQLPITLRSLGKSLGQRMDSEGVLTVEPNPQIDNPSYYHWSNTHRGIEKKYMKNYSIHCEYKKQRVFKLMTMFK